MRQAFDPDDPFSSQLAQMRSKVGDLAERSGALRDETNRAVAATGFAELRRDKQRLIAEELPKLQACVKKGKGVGPEVVQARLAQLDALASEIDAVGDGANVGARPLRPQAPEARGGFLGLGRKAPNLGEIQLSDLNADDPELDPAYYNETAEAAGFRQDWLRAREVQDAYLDRIGRGVGDMKEIAQAQADEINRQAPLVDAVEERVETVTSELRNNNVKLKQVVTSIRSTRKFCIDFVLLMVVLGIGMYIFSVVT